MENISPTEQPPKIPQKQELSFRGKLEALHEIKDEIKSLIQERDALIGWDFNADGKEKAMFTQDPKVEELNTKMLALIQDAKNILPENKRAEFVKKCFAIGTPEENAVGNFVLRELPAMPKPEKAKPKSIWEKMFR